MNDKTMRVDIINHTPSFNMEGRKQLFDSIKFWLIVLVVIGHLAPRVSVKDFHITEVIYSFHMPLFIFISGYFTKKKPYDIFWKNILNFLIPLVFIQLLNIIGHFFLDNTIPGIFDIVIPYWTLWYLLSMVYWKLIIQILPDQTDRNKILFLTIFFVLSFLVNYINNIPYEWYNGRIFSIQRTLVFLPFFYIGYLLKGSNIIDKVRNLKLVHLFFPAIMSYVIFTYFMKNDILMDIFSGADYCPNILDRCLADLLAVSMSVLFIRCIPNSNYIARLGQSTMQIYLLHGIIIEYLFVNIFHNLNNHDFNIFEIVMSTAIIIATTYFLGKTKIINKITKPIKP